MWSNLLFNIVQFVSSCFVNGRLILGGYRVDITMNLVANVKSEFIGLFLFFPVVVYSCFLCYCLNLSAYVYAPFV